jgi:integrase
MCSTSSGSGSPYVKPPKVRALPDVFSLAEVAQVLRATRCLRYRVFFLTTYSLGLRLGEARALEVGHIDAAAGRVHVHDAKGGQDRFVPLPELTLRSPWIPPSLTTPAVADA